MKNALIIFAKAPVPGEVKTRLLSRYTPQEAVELYKGFLIDTLKIATKCLHSHVCGDLKLFLACTPSADYPFFMELSECFEIELIEQRGENLGKRMEHAFTDAIIEGYRRVVIMGSDSPTLPPDFIVEAFSKLTRDDLVIGPTEDGGYYLVGVSDNIPPLFDGIAWGTNRVFDETLKRVKYLKLRFSLLPVWYDIDVPEDMDR